MIVNLSYYCYYFIVIIKAAIWHNRLDHYGRSVLIIGTDTSKKINICCVQCAGAQTSTVFVVQ